VGMLVAVSYHHGLNYLRLFMAQAAYNHSLMELSSNIVLEFAICSSVDLLAVA